MSWAGHLQIDYRRVDGSTRAQDRHEGPLRVLKALYPEGPGICHHTLVHPPGGVAGGDTLDVSLDLAAGSHAVLTTPGATRFYRTAGAPARQGVQARLAPGARLEWLPLENIVHDGADVHNTLRFELAPGAEMFGWDVLALGLPATGEAWSRGRVHQHVALGGDWLESARIDADDRRLIDGPLGWAGRHVLATLWWGAGDDLGAARVEAALETARALLPPPGDLVAGVSAPGPRVVVLRVLAPRVEPAMRLLNAVRSGWRAAAWGLAPTDPRVWST